MKATSDDTKRESMKPKPSQFEMEYFIQTRREIDTEKQERNKLLNYGVLAIGALALALAQIEKSIEFLMDPVGIALYIPLLVLISGLVAARRMKLRQIADRWLTLYDMIQQRDIGNDWMPIENVVVKGFKGRRYLYEDLWLHIGLSLIVYGLISMVIATLLQKGYYLYSALGIVVILIHFLATLKWLLRPFRLAERNIQKDTKK